MFRVKAIQAQHGDALLISYGEEGSLRHILIDGGPKETVGVLLGELDAIREDGLLTLEALIVTHYDEDHIVGINELLANKPDWLEISDIWFNGYRHLTPPDEMGGKDGDVLTEFILRGDYAWNNAFDGGRIHQDSTPVSLGGGMKVHVLSPDTERLAQLRSHWTNPREFPTEGDDGDEDSPADLMGRDDPWPPGKFQEVAATEFKTDTSKPNGSSIALLLEFDEKRALLTGDAFSAVVESALRRLFPSPPDIDLLKVSHHGSKKNTSPKLLAAMNCRRFLVSTSGKSHKHPDNALIARLLDSVDEPEIVFNYSVELTTRWSAKYPRGWPVFTAVYPEDGKTSVDVWL